MQGCERHEVGQIHRPISNNKILVIGTKLLLQEADDLNRSFFREFQTHAIAPDPLVQHRFHTGHQVRCAVFTNPHVRISGDAERGRF